MTSAGGRRRVVVHTLSYLPWRRIGAELATHGLLEHLADAGWTPIVVPGQHPDAGVTVVDGVHVAPSGLAAGINADLVITHVPLTEPARRTAARTGCPIVVTAHGGPGGWIASQVRTSGAALAVVNSQTMRAGVARAGVPTCVLRPPVWPDGPPADRTGADTVTLINGSKDKGGAVLAQIARRLPHLRYQVVEGGYGHTHPALLDAPNVTVIPHGTPMDEVWDRTMLLLAPSIEESWGMAAAEAMHRGIPVIAATPAGLSECVGGGGKLIPREHLRRWTTAVDEITSDPAAMAHAQVAAWRRAAALWPAGDLRATERELASLIGVEVEQGMEYRNVRTGEVVDAVPGTRLHARLTGAPLVWQPVQPVPHPVPEAARPGTARALASVPDLPPPTPTNAPAPPAHDAPDKDWADYAVSRGADPTAARKAPRPALIALYG